MKRQTINFINHLNQDFYRQVGSEFDHTRQAPWLGWSTLMEYIPSPPTSSPYTILDIGCGNGRFADFLRQQWPHIELNYTGIDTNQHLLQKAQQRSQSKLTITTHLLDVVTTEVSSQINQAFDLVVLFGIVHHIPSFQLRQRIMATAAKLTKPGGYTAFTFWQFLNNHALKQRIHQPPSPVHDDLEPGDYFLDWQPQTNIDPVLRYAHAVDSSEMHQLIAPLQIEIKAQFQADGKTNNQNTYLISHKIAPKIQQIKLK